MTTRPLKVWGWTGLLPIGEHNPRRPCTVQCRCIVASETKRAAKAVVEAHGDQWRPAYVSETANHAELKAALARPNVLLWKHMDDWDGPFRIYPMPPEESMIERLVRARKERA